MDPPDKPGDDGGFVCYTALSPAEAMAKSRMAARLRRARVGMRFIAPARCKLRAGALEGRCRPWLLRRISRHG